MSTRSNDNFRSVWNKLHNEFKQDKTNILNYDSWLDNYSDVIDGCQSEIIDLGCGSGNDTLYLIDKGKKVISCDYSINAINNIKKKFPEVYDTKCFNMLDGLPFDDNSFDIVIADLSLHYFREEDTFKIINEIKRVLTDKGSLIFRVNSINDVNHGAGEGIEIEHHLYETSDKRLKRFFDEKDIKYFFKDFDIEFLNEEIMTRYELEKRLYRCLAKKSFND